MDRLRRIPSSKFPYFTILLMYFLTCNGEQLSSSSQSIAVNESDFTTTSYTDLVTSKLIQNNDLTNTSTVIANIKVNEYSTEATHNQNAKDNFKNESSLPVISPTNSETCIGYRKLSVQPIYSKYAQVTKCTATESKVDVAFAWAVFYENCIEDLENATELPDEIFNPCSSATHSTFVYGDLDDERLFVLQNGSLFHSNSNFTEYDVFETYCLYADEESGKTLALVCYDRLVTVSKAQGYLYAICKSVFKNRDCFNYYIYIFW